MILLLCKRLQKKTAAKGFAPLIISPERTCVADDDDDDACDSSHGLVRNYYLVSTPITGLSFENNIV